MHKSLSKTELAQLCDLAGFDVERCMVEVTSYEPSLKEICNEILPCPLHDIQTIRTI